MAYSNKYISSEFTRGEHTFQLIIAERDFSGTAVMLEGIKGIWLEVQGSSEPIEAPIVKTNLTWTVVDAPDMNTTTKKWGGWEELFTPDALKYRVQLLRDDDVVWTGFITPDSWSENLAYHAPLTFTARDLIGHLSDFDFSIDDVTVDSDGLSSVKDLMEAAWEVASIPMSLSIFDKTKWLQSGTNNAYEHFLIDLSLYEGKTWYQVVENVLATMGLVLRYVGGNKLWLAPLRYLPYLSSSSLATRKTATILNKSGVRTIDLAYKQIIENGQYEIYADDTAYIADDEWTIITRTGQPPLYQHINKPGWHSADYDVYPVEQSLADLLGDLGGELQRSFLVFDTPNRAITLRHQYKVGSNTPIRVTWTLNHLVARLTLPGSDVWHYQSLDSQGTISNHYGCTMRWRLRFVPSTGGNLYLTEARDWAALSDSSEDWTGVNSVTNRGAAVTQQNIDVDCVTPNQQGSLYWECNISAWNETATTPDNLASVITGLNLAIDGASVPKGWKVTTNYDENQNTILKRDCDYGICPSWVKLPGTIRNGIYLRNAVTVADGTSRALSSCNWGGEATLSAPMPVWSALQILTYHTKANSVFEGDIKVSDDYYDFGKLLRLPAYEGSSERILLLRSGTLDLMTGYITGAIMEEVGIYASEWDGITSIDYTLVNGGEGAYGSGGASGGSGGSGSGSGHTHSNKPILDALDQDLYDKINNLTSWFELDEQNNAIRVAKDAGGNARNFYSFGEISAGGAGTGGGGTAGIDRIFFGTQKYQAEEGSLAINIPLTGTNGIKGVLGITALEQAIIDAGKIDDVKVDGVSVVTNKIANITLSGYQPLIDASHKLAYSLISGTPTSLPASDVYDWAKASTKPSYAFSEIAGTASTSQIPTLAISKISGLQTALDGKYVKPTTGIPATDLTTAVQTSLGKADSAYQKPSTGIPYADLASGVKGSLDKADSALQSHQTIYTLTVQKNGTAVGTYTPNSAAKTINLTDVASAATLADFKTLFESMFERVGSGTASSPYKIHAKYGFYSDYEISAGGDGTGGGGGGLIENVYGYTDLGGTYSDSVKTNTFNAYTIARLASRITSLEERPAGGVTSFNTRTGAVVLTAADVNAVISYQAPISDLATIRARADEGHTAYGYFSNGKLPYTSVSGTPTALKNPYALSWSGYSSGSYDGGEAKSLTIPSNTNQLTNGAGFITASALSGYATESWVNGKGYAVQGAHNNLIASGNEFTFASSGFDGAIKLNYRTAGGINGNITDYLFCNGKGGTLVYLSTLISQSANGNTAYGWGNHASAGYALASALSGYLPLSGGTMTGNIQIGSYTSFGVSGSDFYLGNPSYPLRIRSNGTTTLNGNTIYHSGNVNNTSTPWSASSLTLNGAISGATTINASGIVTCDSVVGKNITYYDNATGCYVGSAKNALGSTYTGAIILAYGDNPIYFFTNGSRRMQILGNGNVGIGTPSPSEKLTVAGNITATGEISAGSDRRWKHDIKPVADGLSAILRLQPSEWTWNSDNHKGSGLIAQDVQSVLPHLVKTDGNGYLHLAYDGFHAYEISAIQQLHKRIAELEKEIQTLKQS